MNCKQTVCEMSPAQCGIAVLVAMKRSPLQDWRSLDNLKPYVIGQVRGYS